MTVIGITGGIGSGKSTLCGFFEAKGIPVINADRLAKSLMILDLNLKNQIISKFGVDSYNKDGSLNTGNLSQKAFTENRVSELNELVHPLVRLEVLKLIDGYALKGFPLVVYEAALLLDYGKPDFVDIVIWMETDPLMRIDRVTKRDHTDPQLVRERMTKQITFESVRDFIDIVIHNSGDLHELESVSNKLIQEIVK